MIGVEFTTPDGKPDAATVKAVQARCLEQDLLLLNCGTYGNVIRWVPPLVVTEEQIATALAAFERAVGASA